MLKLERDLTYYTFPYSLHDARVVSLSYEAERLKFSFDKVFSYDESGKERTYTGSLTFNGLDKDEMRILVFDETLGEGAFSGQVLDLDTFIRVCSEAQFEVLTETYHWCQASFEGWLWQKDRPVHCVMRFFFRGKLVYELEEIK